MTAGQAAKQFGIARSTAYRLIKEVGKHSRVALVALDQMSVLRRAWCPWFSRRTWIVRRRKCK
ncbi:hypothetical protein [Tritonibacter scottomollicae]